MRDTRDMGLSAFGYDRRSALARLCVGKFIELEPFFRELTITDALTLTQEELIRVTPVRNRLDMLLFSKLYLEPLRTKNTGSE